MRIIILITLISITAPVAAQVVNIEQARIHTDTTGWAGDAGAGFSFTQNTAQVFAANANLHVQYKTQRNLFLAVGEYGFLKASGTGFVDFSFIHFRYNRKIGRVLRWEVFTQLQDNKVTRIDYRYLLGSGPRFKLADSRKLHLYLATLAMYELEREKGQSTTQHLRQSSYLSVTWLPAPLFDFTSTLFYQPRWDRPGDYRVLHQAVARVRASKRVAITLHWNFLYDAFPAAGVPRRTINFTTGFQCGLGRKK